MLVAAEGEQPGYALYSYMLFGSSGGSRERFVALARAWKSELQDVGEFAANGVPRAKLNITYFLVNSKEPSTTDAEWLVDQYNYTRARIYLDKLPGSRRADGPYIVSVPQPLGGVDQVRGRFLFQDLSSVPPSLIGPWVREFTNQVAQENYWQPPAMDDMVLKLRTNIEIAAMALPDVKKAAEEWRSILATVIVHQK
ncbi:MAG TPA: hypothetical protein VGV35_02995 [Bryobacteraceae bacterium]|nr:hypothetical protein [Bryobacteraceae bacterium]